MQIFLGDLVTMMKNETIVTGRVEGVKMRHGELERVAIVGIDGWLYVNEGWLFAEEEEAEREDDA